MIRIDWEIDFSSTKKVGFDNFTKNEIHSLGYNYETFDEADADNLLDWSATDVTSLELYLHRMLSFSLTLNADGTPKDFKALKITKLEE